MPLSTEEKQKIIKTYGQNENDSGSPQVQVALLTERINQLTEHFKTHKKDHHGRRGLLKMVGQRRRLLTYVTRTDAVGYEKLIKDLKLRR